MAAQHQKKRKYNRIKSRFLVRFRIYKAKSPKWDMVTIKDLSARGIYFNYDKKIPLSTLLEFNITLPTITEAIHCQGMVCRVDKQASRRKDIKTRPIYGIFAIFTQIENEKEKIIDAFAKGL